MAMLAINIPVNISRMLQEINVPSEIIRQDYADHITCFYFEKFDTEDILKIIPVILNITKSINVFNISVDSYKSFPEGKYGWPVICEIESKELNKLRDKIKKEFDKNDIEYSKKFPKFIAHTTLSYVKEKVKNKKIDEIIWPVNNISLYCGEDNKEKLYIEFQFEGNKEKYSSDCLNEIAEYFKKTATA